MLKRAAFLAACGLNLTYASGNPFRFEGAWPTAASSQVLVGGAISLMAALLMGVLILRENSPLDRGWTKSALALLALCPFAFSLLLWPNAADAVCIGRGCYSDTALALRQDALSNVMQTQAAMIAVSLVALICSAVVWSRSWPGRRRSRLEVTTSLRT